MIEVNYASSLVNVPLWRGVRCKVITKGVYNSFSSNIGCWVEVWVNNHKTIIKTNKQLLEFCKCYSSGYANKRWLVVDPVNNRKMVMNCDSAAAAVAKAINIYNFDSGCVCVDDYQNILREQKGCLYEVK
jgi:hypothetical protein